MFNSLAIPPIQLDSQCESLRHEVRAFLAETLSDRSPSERAESWSGFDRDFSGLVGARGWIGMTWPKKYGGHERSSLERYVVLEEFLAAGAPVSAYWMADRQSGPTILRFGSEQQRLDILPRIVKGELCFSAGLSEPDVGSDLASVRARADWSPSGWLVNGRKIWITNGHRADYMIALLRTDHDPQRKHSGLSQFLIDLRNTPGMLIRGIQDIRGKHEFNEITFDNMLLPESALIGTRGEGWQQINAELVLERSGPERYLSSIELFKEMLDCAAADDSRACVKLGTMVAELATLRQMSMGVAGMLAMGENPALQATIVKHQGAEVEQRTPELAHDLFGPDLGAGDSRLVDVMKPILQVAPSISLRGGTREILRGIIARGLGLR